MSGLVLCVASFSPLHGQFIPNGLYGITAPSSSLAMVVTGQTSTSTPSSIPATTTSSYTQALATFQAEQQALAASFRQLMAQGATSDQLQAWQQQNTTRILAQQQRFQAISASQPVQPIPYVTEVQIPDGASQTMVDFLTARANLQNLRAQLHNQQLASFGTVDEAQVETQFQQQNAATLQTQTQRAQTLGQESDSQPSPVPPPLVIPAGTSTPLQQFLTLRDQLMREEIQIHNGNLSLSSTAQEAAIQQWRLQNSQRFQQLQADAQNLASTSSN